MKALAVLVWHQGEASNLISITSAIASGQLNATVSVVVSDRNEGNGVAFARAQGFPVYIEKAREILANFLISEMSLDFIVLAGWKRIISDRLIEAFPERVLNLHPGLIPDALTGVVLNPDTSPALWNRGLYGIQAIENFLLHRATYAGSSISVLTSEFDFGPVIKRGFVPVFPTDTVETLYARLKKKENEIYVEALIELCAD